MKTIKDYIDEGVHLSDPEYFETLIKQQPKAWRDQSPASHWIARARQDQQEAASWDDWQE